MKKYILLALSTLALSACAKQTFVIGSDAIEPNKVETNHFFLSGVGQERTINAIKVCGSLDKVARVEVQQTFTNGFLGFITFGLYTPREMRVYCKYDFS